MSIKPSFYHHYRALLQLAKEFLLQEFAIKPLPQEERTRPPLPEAPAPQQPLYSPKKEKPALETKPAFEEKPVVEVKFNGPPPSNDKWKLQPLGPAPYDPFHDMRQKFQKAPPSGIALLEEIQDDAAAKAKRFGLGFCPKVIVLSLRETSEEYRLLKNIASAIHLHLGSTELVDALKIDHLQQWPELCKIKELQLVVATLPTAKHIPALSTLFPHKLLILEELSNYLRYPKQKKQLWDDLCQKLK